MSGFHEALLDELPAGWRADRMGNVADILFSNVDKHTFESEVPVRLCNYVDVYKNDRITSSINFMEASAEPREIARFQIKKGDVLATKDSETPDDIAIPALVAEELPGVLCGYHLALIRPLRHKIHGEYLAWLHCSKYFRSHYETQAVGVTRFGLSQNAFKEARVPLPSLPEQQRIAAYLDASCAAIDAAVSAKRSQIETLAHLRENIIQKVVTQGLDPLAKTRPSGVSWLGAIPKHWQDGNLKRYAKRIQTGLTPPTDTPEYYEDGTIPWFAPGSFESQIELTEPRKLINELALSDGVLRMFPAQSVFVIGIGATIGKVGVIAEAASCNQQIIGIVCDHRMLPRFLAYQMKIYEVVIPGICVATTLPIFNQVQIGSLPVVAPPVAEQQAICDYIDTKLSESNKVVGVLEAQISTLTAYRKSLIHECVTGQRRITEADLRAIQKRTARMTPESAISSSSPA